MKKLLFGAAALFALSFHSCKKESESTTLQHWFTGSPAAMGGGQARTWVETGDGNQPISVGISFDKSVFTAMPDNHGGETSYKLSLPAQKSGTPFDHVVVDWNPHGHPPEHVYDKPHFDFHFYMMGEAERMAIPEYGDDSTGFLNYPAPDFLPANYIPIPGGEAMMGTHWADITSPELSQSALQPFTQTFIYGSYGGKVTFYEPMVTLDFLTHTSSFVRAIPQPSKWSRDGYYPTKMSITDKGGTVDVKLYDFVYHAKS